MSESTGHVTDLLPGYTLGILEEAESLQVIEHLQICSDCQRELNAYQPVMAALGQSAPRVELPSDLRSRLLAKAAEQVIERKSIALPNTHLPIPIWKSLLSWKLLGALGVLLLIVSNLVLWGRVNQLSHQANLNGFRAVALIGSENSPNASGTIIISHDGKYGTLIVDDLEQLDEQHQYQLWLIEDDQRVNGGVFSVSKSGYGTIEVWSERPLDSYDGFGITVEPAGGSESPTGMKVLGGDI